MPLFEYVCEKCGKTRELLVALGVDPLPRPLCCNEPMRRLYDSFGFVMK